MVRKEVIRLLETNIIYPTADSKWVSFVHCVPKMRGTIVVPNKYSELIPQITGNRMCIDYRKLNKATYKYHYSLLCIDQMLQRLFKHLGSVWELYFSFELFR